MVGGLLLAVFIYFPEGFFGSAIRDICTSIFGWPVYLLPILLIVNGIHKCAKTYEQHKSKYTYIAIGIAILSVFTHMFIEKQNPLELQTLKSYFLNGAQGIGGGFFGGFCADVLRALIGQAASFIITLTAFVVITMMLFNWSPVKLLLRGIIKAYMRATGKRFKIPAAKNQKSKEQIAIGDNGEVEFVNFTDEDLGIEQKPKAKARRAKKSDLSDAEFAQEENDKDIMADFDKVIDDAIPAFINSNIEKSNVKSSYEAVTGESDDTPYELDNEADEVEFSERTYVDAPEKLTGMEDVSDEMESAFERIPYTFPPISLLNDSKSSDNAEDLRYELRETAQKLIAILKSFNIDAKPMGCSKGPTVTRYEIMLGEGIKVSKISGLIDDLALRLFPEKKL